MQLEMGNGVDGQALTIDPATLLVTVDPVSRLYGAANPAFSATVSGFLFEDTLAKWINKVDKTGNTNAV